MEHVVTFEWTLVLILQGHPHGDSHIVMRVETKLIGAWKEVNLEQYPQRGIIITF